jgi:hypothetical protein
MACWIGNTMFRLTFETIKELEEFELNFEVLNAVPAPDKHPKIAFRVMVE